MSIPPTPDLEQVIAGRKVAGALPYRLALAGGWIDQPFVSRHDPQPPGSMVVVSVQPRFYFMDRSGLASSTRKVALELWGGELPPGDPWELVQELYAAENRGKLDPSGSQDMIGLVYPGINRLDYAYAFQGGVFPAHIETCTDLQTAHWLESVLHLLPVAQRPPGYYPLGEQHLDPAWVRRLGGSGKECFEAILAHDVSRLGESLNECMRCWEALLPHTIRHPAITVDLPGLLGYYQSRYPGAMYSGCGGGYLYVVSEEPVEGAFQIRVRTGREKENVQTMQDNNHDNNRRHHHGRPQEHERENDHRREHHHKEGLGGPVRRNFWHAWHDERHHQGHGSEIPVGQMLSPKEMEAWREFFYKSFGTWPEEHWIFGGRRFSPWHQGMDSFNPFVANLLSKGGGLLPLYVLHLVSQKPRYGNEIMDLLAESTNGQWVSNPGAIYPLLALLEREGFIQGRWEDLEKRTVRIYTITPAGQAEISRIKTIVTPKIEETVKVLQKFLRDLQSQNLDYEAE